MAEPNIRTLNIALPVFLPGPDRDWAKFGGIARITTSGEIYISFQDDTASKALIEMAKNNKLLQVGFDYRMSDAEIKELNERYTKKIVSQVGSFPIMAEGEAVGTAIFKSDGTIEMSLENHEELHTIDTNKE